VVAQVKSAFSGVLVAQATLALAEQNLATLDEIERLQRVGRKGDVSQLELLACRCSASRSSETLGRTPGDRGRQDRAAGRHRQAVADSFDVVGEPTSRDVPLDRDQLRQRAWPIVPTSRPRRRRGQGACRREPGAANAWWDVTPQIEYQRIGPDNTIGFGFSFPLRIFDRNQGEIARTRAEAERSDALTRSAAIQALAEVDTALSAVTIQRARVVMLRDTYLPKAQQARTTVEFAYRRGGASLLDFLDAQRTYRETALEHLRAIGNFSTAL
jgi:cobalt-zinc-cadmium efflux system outer membrane protein